MRLLRTLTTSPPHAPESLSSWAIRQAEIRPRPLATSAQFAVISALQASIRPAWAGPVMATNEAARTPAAEAIFISGTPQNFAFANTSRAAASLAARWGRARTCDHGTCDYNVNASGRISFIPYLGSRNARSTFRPIDAGQKFARRVGWRKTCLPRMRSNLYLKRIWIEAKER